jgi:Rho GDP-dissociation inhibitor
VKQLALVVVDRPDMVLNLTGDISQLKKQVNHHMTSELNKSLFICRFQVFFIKEGVSYRIRIDFLVQREIVHGLKYVQKTSRLGVPGMINFLIILKLNCWSFF